MDTPDDVTGPVNLGNPVEMPIKMLAERIMDLTGAKSKLVFRPLPQDDPLQRCPHISLAKRLLEGWEPKVDLDDGLKKTVEYFDALMSEGPEAAQATTRTNVK